IWRERLQAGDPDMLLGLPVHYLEFMPEGMIGLGGGLVDSNAIKVLEVKAASN
ncbi:phage major capsid protein, partial [Xenorhabdus sp. Flor]|nr:phage major capsid protein [Xenorhabdus sp. Flor]